MTTNHCFIEENFEEIEQVYQMKGLKRLLIAFKEEMSIFTDNKYEQSLLGDLCDTIGELAHHSRQLECHQRGKLSIIQ